MRYQLMIIDDLGTEPREVMEFGNVYTPLIDLITTRYEEENKLLKVNTEELMKLNDNIHEMRTGLDKLANEVHYYEYKIASKTLKQIEDLGNGLISKLGNELDVEYFKFESPNEGT